MPITPERVREQLRQVYDPEIPLNIVDLGLVYEIRVKPAMQVASELATPSDIAMEEVEVDMTLTSQHCPSHTTIEAAVKNAVERIEGVQSASVKFVFEPAWGPEKISPAGRESLGIEI